MELDGASPVAAPLLGFDWDDVSVARPAGARRKTMLTLVLVPSRTTVRGVYPSSCATRVVLVPGTTLTVTSPVPRRRPDLKTSASGGEMCTATRIMSEVPDSADLNESVNPAELLFVAFVPVASVVGTGTAVAGATAAGVRDGAASGRAGGSAATVSGSEVVELLTSQIRPAEATMPLASSALQGLCGRNSGTEDAVSASI